MWSRQLKNSKRCHPLSFPLHFLLALHHNIQFSNDAKQVAR